jgi:hypothetical protein
MNRRHLNRQNVREKRSSVNQPKKEKEQPLEEAPAAQQCACKEYRRASNECSEDASAQHGIKQQEQDQKEKSLPLNAQENFRTPFENIREDARAIERWNGDEIKKGKEKVHENNNRDQLRQPRTGREQVREKPEHRPGQHVRGRARKGGE